MTTPTHPFRFAALTGFALILPFLIIEAVNGRASRDGVLGVAVLFALLWLLPTLSIGSSLRMLHPAGTSRITPRTRLVLSAAIVLAAAGIWGTLLADQLPCFLGVPNCD